MNRRQFQGLDQFLVIADVTGQRFGVAALEDQCALKAYADHLGIVLRSRNDYTSISSALGLCSSETDSLWAANDASDGDPKAVRACLHRLYPQFVDRSVRPPRAVDTLVERR